MIRQKLFCYAIAITSTLIFKHPAIGLQNDLLQKNQTETINQHSQIIDNFEKPTLLAQAQFQIDIGELGYDFTPITQAQAITMNWRDPFGQNSPTPAIQFLVEAKQFVTPLGYFAYFYDRNGVEVGFVPVDINPAGSIKAGQRMYVTIPLILLNENTQISRMIIRRI